MFRRCRRNVLRCGLIPQVFQIHQNDRRRAGRKEIQTALQRIVSGKAAQHPPNSSALLALDTGVLGLQEFQLEPCIDIAAVKEGLKRKQIVSIQTRNRPARRPPQRCARL